MDFRLANRSSKFCSGVLAVSALLLANCLVAALALEMPYACDTSSRPCDNGGTCVSLPGLGGRVCQCPNGWTGANCSVDVDECESSPCKNGGRCINQLNRKFRCDCQAGFVGTFCEYPDPCISRKCHEGATCTVMYPNWTERVCTCQRGFTGDDCSEDINECELATSPACLNGGECVNSPGSYSCRCPPGFIGFDCSEQKISECRPDLCLNGGSCLMDLTGNETCVCRTGFSGRNCQHQDPTTTTTPRPVALAPDCSSEPCQHGGRCMRSGNNFTCECAGGWGGQLCSIGCAKEGWCRNGGRCSVEHDSVVCRCPEGFSGHRCELTQPAVQRANPCSRHRCLNGATCSSAADGSHECLCREGYEGRHCEVASAREPPPQPTAQSPKDADESEVTKDPWAACPARLQPHCRAVFADGRCDRNCSGAAGCLQDGFDCAAELGDCPNSHCARLFADGICDPQCNTSECLLDGGDCVGTDAVNGGRIVLLVKASLESLQAEMVNLLSQLSRSLRLTLRLDGEVKKDPTAGGLRLRLRVLGCIGASYGASCRVTEESGREASRLLTELLARKRLQPRLPLAVLAEPPKPTTTPTPRDEGQLVALLIGICSLLACALLAGVLYSAAKRRRVTTQGTWKPPGFQPISKSSHHTAASSSLAAAARHDSSSMSLSLSSSSSPLETLVQCSGGKYPGDCSGGSVSCQLLGPSMCKRAKYEDTTFLSSELLKPLTSTLSTGSMSTAATVVPASDSAVELCNVSSAGAAGETPLHLAARYCRADATRHLLESGADPNAPDQFGRTPLHLAIASGAHGAALLLMGSPGADLNARTDDGSTPLIVAAKYCELDIASSLLACPQVDPGAADNTGKTALHWAASVNASDLVALLLCRGANRDPPDSLERTPLFLAAYEGAAGAATRLLEAGANRDACDASGRSPAQAAEARLHMDIARMLRCPPTPAPQHQPPPPPPPPRQSSLAKSSQCDYNVAQQHYPLHHYPTPPSHAGLEDSPPHQQLQTTASQQPPPLPPHQTALANSYQQQQQQQQQYKLQLQQHPTAVGFLTPSPDSGQDSPGQWSATSYAPNQSYLTPQPQLPQQQQQAVCYENSRFFYPPLKREVL